MRAPLVLAALACCVGVADDVRAQPGAPTLVVYVYDPAGGPAEADSIEVLSPFAHTTTSSLDELPPDLHAYAGAGAFRIINVMSPAPRTVIPVLYRGTCTILIVDRMPEVWTTVTFAPVALRGRALAADMRDDAEALQGRPVIPPSRWREVEEPSDLRDRSGVDWARLSLAAVSGDEASVRALMAESGPECCSLALQALAHAGRRGGLLLLLGRYPKDASRAVMLRDALSHAVETGHIEIVKLLLEAGADPNLPARRINELPLENALRNQRLDSLKALLPECTKQTLSQALVPAMYHPQGDEVIKMLLAAGADVNVRVYNWDEERAGATVLGKAARVGPEYAAHFLLLLAGKVSDEALEEALVAVTGNLGPGAVRALLEKRGVRAARGTEDPALTRVLADAFDEEGRYAAFDGNFLESARMLIEAGASLNAVSHNGRLPLALVARGGNVEGVKLLLGLGADVNAADADGRTALSHVIENTDPSAPGFLETVRVLLEAGADANVADANGMTPLSLAEERGLSDFVELLRRGPAPR